MHHQGIEDWLILSILSLNFFYRIGSLSEIDVNLRREREELLHDWLPLLVIYLLPELLPDGLREYKMRGGKENALLPGVNFTNIRQRTLSVPGIPLSTRLCRLLWKTWILLLLFWTGFSSTKWYCVVPGTLSVLCIRHSFFYHVYQGVWINLG